MKRMRGFTLVEMVVVTGIIVVLTSILLANYNKFGGVISLRNVVYDIALSMRQAQTYGISVLKFGSGAGSFAQGYGMHFERASPTDYVLYGDTNADGLYEAGESVALLSMTGGYKLHDLCVTTTNNTTTCGLQQLDITFKRPDPDAFIRGNNSTAPLYGSAQIIVQSPRGDQMSVIVELTGQISVQ